METQIAQLMIQLLVHYELYQIVHKYLEIST
jgi:hypothetical protein